MAGDFVIGGTIRSTVDFDKILDQQAALRQAALKYAEQVGITSLRINTPYLTGDLVSTADSHENQYSVWLTIAGEINGRPYGYAQEAGWHSGGAFHEGHHMVEYAGYDMHHAFLTTYGIGGGSGFLIRGEGVAGTGAGIRLTSSDERGFPGAF